MPPLSTHFRLATLVMPSLGIVSHPGYFILGTTAPDAFEPESEGSFAWHHFIGDNGRISLHKFLEAVTPGEQRSDASNWSFTCGYYCHLWLDVFYRDNAERIPFKRPAGIPDTDLRALLRKEMEILNAPFVLKAAELPIPRPDEIRLPPGLEFINHERCLLLFHEVIRQSQEWSVLLSEFKSIDQAGYAAFLEDASQLFLDEQQALAR